MARFVTEFLVEENTNKTQQLASLVETTHQLEEKKADREYVEAGLDLVRKRAIWLRTGMKYWKVFESNFQFDTNLFDFSF
jgi:hypothetical protein